MLPPTDYDMRSHSTPHGELNADYRARVMREQAENVARRQEELLEQTSELNTPEARVRIWERLHSLALPRNPSHPLLRVVATQTGLSLEQVKEEQQKRMV
jgi:hypothetical protein